MKNIVLLGMYQVKMLSGISLSEIIVTDRQTQIR